MQRPAAVPEGPRGGARARARRRAPGADPRGRVALRAQRRLPQPGDLRVSRRRLGARGRPALRLHRNQRPPSGRAHSHRGGDRRRPRPGSDPARRGRIDRRAWARRSESREATRNRNPGTSEHGGHRRGRSSPSFLWHPHRLRSTQWSRRSHRWLRLRRVPGERRLRLAPRQGDRPLAGLLRRDCPHLARTERVPARGDGDQHSFPPEHPRPRGLRRRTSAHPLGRRAGRAPRRSEREEAPALRERVEWGCHVPPERGRPRQRIRRRESRHSRPAGALRARRRGQVTAGRGGRGGR